MLIAALAISIAAPGPDFPRIANLWGSGATTAGADQWAKYDLLVIGGGSESDIRAFHDSLTARNPGIRLLATAPLMNIGGPEGSPWMKDEWYLRRPSGETINWWAGQIYVPNILADACLDALVEQTVDAYGPVLADGALDGAFYDSVVGSASWLGEVDTDRDGVADVPPEVDPKWHARQCRFFDRLRELYPNMLVLANDVDSGHAPHLNGRLFEGATLLDRVANHSMDPGQAAEVLRGWMADSLQPGVTFALACHPLGWQGWRVGKGQSVTTPGEVDRVRRDFRRMRLGLTTALMSDAYYAYDFGTVWYGLPLWYAEYDAPLGQPLGPAREVADVPPVPVLDWSAGQPTDGLVLDAGAVPGPDGIDCAAPDDATGWRRLLGTNPRSVALRPGHAYRIEAECQVLKAPGVTFQFNVRTPTGGYLHHDKGVEQNASPAGTTWSIRTTVVPDDFDDYSAEWHCAGAGALRVKSLRVLLVDQVYLMREFQGGVAVVNPLPVPVDVRFDPPMRRLKDDACPRHIVEQDDSDEGFSAPGAWQTLAGEGSYYGVGYRSARKPGEAARWSIVAPSTDTYTVFACVPKLEEVTDAAHYLIAGEGDQREVVLDQHDRDGGWIPLGEVSLREGQTYGVDLQSSGTGATVADAIRWESMARLNDGAQVPVVTLAPFDGTVLVRE